MDELRVEREATFDAPPEEVWKAITDERLLEEWLADEARLDPEPGGEVRVRMGDEVRSGQVEHVEDGKRLVFTWQRDDEGSSTVELSIEPRPYGTRLLVVERTFAGPLASGCGGRWQGALATLARALELVVA